MADGPAPVPLCDVAAQYRSLAPEIDAALQRVLASGHVINGPDVAAFEQEAAAYCGVAYAIGCADGTTALSLALAALDVGPGDEVIVPTFTFFATVGSVVRCGARPVFVDSDPHTYNLDVGQLDRAVSERTRAIIPVHLFGQCADMGPVQEMASRYGLHVIEDAAQAFGADLDGRRAGSLGTISTFSFYPSKNLAALGDAGMVTTDDPALARRLLALRNHGSEVKYYHKYIGWNARLDTLHAAMLRVKLQHVDAWIEARRQSADRYDGLIDAAFPGGLLRQPVRETGRTHTFNQYVVRVNGGNRDALVKHLKANGIGCEVYYPLPLHLQECLSYLGHRAGEFPVSEEAAGAVLALPMFPEITEEQQRRVVETCASFSRQQVRRAA